MLAAALLWGTTGTVAHQAPAGSSQLAVGLATFGFGGLVLLALSWPAVVGVLRDRSARWLVAVGVVGVLGYASLYYVSMALVGVAVGNALALGSGPVFAAGLELVIERRRPARAWVVATAVSLAGMALLSWAGATGAASVVDPAAGAGAGLGLGGWGGPVLGVVCGLGAGFGYALYSWAGARLSVGRSSRGVMAAIFGVSSVVLVPWFLLVGPGVLLTGTGPWVLTYLVLLPMAAAYLLFGYGLGGMAASAATTLALAEPVVATCLAVVVLGERLPPVGWVGFALVLAGLGLVARAEAAHT